MIGDVQTRGRLVIKYFSDRMPVTNLHFPKAAAFRGLAVRTRGYTSARVMNFPGTFVFNPGMQFGIGQQLPPPTTQTSPQGLNSLVV